ncbi:MAG: PQQ-binding-like beta-propeller repeat protein [Phycisphaerales bacterium]
MNRIFPSPAGFRLMGRACTRTQTRTQTPTQTHSLIKLSVCVGVCAVAQLAHGQRVNQSAVANPVYIADAPLAIETIERALALSEQGSDNEAARTLTELIINQGQRFTLRDPVPESEDPDTASPDTPSNTENPVWIPVRTRVHMILQSKPSLLSAYRRINTPKAQRLLDANQWEQAREKYWLTTPGANASLNYAQVLIESARFAPGLRELDRLLSHPDASSISLRALSLVELCARASDQSNVDSRINTLLDQWSSRAGRAPDVGDPFTRPPQSGDQVRALLSAPIDLNQESLRLNGIVPRPIAGAKLTPPPTSDELGSVSDQPAPGAVSQPKPWTMPVLLGDTLIANDGITITSFDRFTLRPKWRLTTTELDTDDQDRSSIGVRSRIARTVEDLSTATIHSDRVYLAAGLARTGGRTGDNRILSIDAQSGALVKQTTLAELDPALEGSTVRGTLLVDGDTLIIAARKNLRRERLVVLALVGINRHTFEHQWTREIGSAGSLPFQQIGQISHSGILDQGIIYWTDMMGLVCAVESATGEALWAKSMPTTDIYARYERDPWTVSTPIVRDDNLFILAAAGQRIDKINARTGDRISSTRSMVSGQGLYLLETPTSLVCINNTAIALHRFDKFAVNKPILATPTSDGRAAFRGRVVTTGESLLVPILDGVGVIDTTQYINNQPANARQLITLETTGMITALDGQLIVAGESEIWSYLSWDIARQFLNDRIENLNDVHAAITMGDLAYRSDHHSEIIPAIDRAIEMLRSSNLNSSRVNADHADARQRLFAIMQDMVGLPGHTSADSTSTPDSPTEIISSEIRDQLIERCGIVARTADQVLAHQMTQGAWQTVLGQIPDAVRVYHGILSNPSLANGMWQGTGLAIRAELEATNQLSRIVSEHGRNACAMFDQLALADTQALSGSRNPEDFEQLARQYPWAPTIPAVWSQAADLWALNDNHAASVRAAQSGFDALERLQVHGLAPDQTTLDSLGSSLITGLLGAQRQSDASRAATRLASDYPSISITVNGQPIDAGQLSIGLSSAQPAPILGSRFVIDQQPALLTGSPVKSPIRTEFDTIVMYAPQLGQARMIRLTDPTNPELLWTRQAPDVEPPIVAVHNEYQTVLIWPGTGSEPAANSIESIETVTGKTRWKLESIGQQMRSRSMRVPDETALVDGQFTTPTQGVVIPDQIITTSDGSVIVMVDRIGRAIGIDILSGQVLWAGELPVNRVHSVDLASGVLGVAGMWYVDHDPERGQVLMRAPRIASIDARTGQTLQLVDAQTSTPRWLRVAPSGNLIVGTSQRILSVSTRTGSLDWVIRNDQLFNTTAGWIVDDSLFVLDEFVNLWPIGLGDGNLQTNPLDTQNRITERGWVNVKPHKQYLSVAASGGFGIFSHDGRTLGIDAQQSSWPYIDAGWATDRIAMVTRAQPGNRATDQAGNEPNDQSKMHIEINMFEQTNALLTDSMTLTLPSAIQRQPTTVQAANGVVVVGFGEVSVLLQTQ